MQRRSPYPLCLLLPFLALNVCSLGGLSNLKVPEAHSSYIILTTTLLYKTLCQLEEEGVETLSYSQREMCSSLILDFSFPLTATLFSLLMGRDPDKGHLSSGLPDPVTPGATLSFPLSRELLAELVMLWQIFPSLIRSQTEKSFSWVHQQHNLLDITLVGSLEVTSGWRVKEHGINLKTTAFIFSSILEKPVWLRLVMTQQNLS